MSERFPCAALLALAAVGFLAIVTETIPAGLTHSLSATGPLLDLQEAWTLGEKVKGAVSQ